jgi:hypothetical protein
MTTTSQRRPAQSGSNADLTKNCRVTRWEPVLFLSSGGQRAKCVFRLVLDYGVDEVAVDVNADDAYTVFVWLSRSANVYYDVNRGVMSFGARDGGR